MHDSQALSPPGGEVPSARRTGKGRLIAMPGIAGQDVLAHPAAFSPSGCLASRGLSFQGW